MEKYQVPMTDCKDSRVFRNRFKLKWISCGWPWGWNVGGGAGCVLGRWPSRSVMMAEVEGDVEWWLNLNTCSCCLVPPTLAPTVRPDVSATPCNSNHQSRFDSCAVAPVQVGLVCPTCRPSIIGLPYFIFKLYRPRPIVYIFPIWRFTVKCGS
jgi:hypothetical protein